MARFGSILVDLASIWGRSGVHSRSIWRPNGRSNDKGPTCDPYAQARTDCMSRPPRPTRKSTGIAPGRPEWSTRSPLVALTGHFGRPRCPIGPFWVDIGRFARAGGSDLAARVAPGRPDWSTWSPPVALTGRLGRPRGPIGPFSVDLGRSGVDLGSIWSRFGSVRTGFFSTDLAARTTMQLLTCSVDPPVKSSIYIYI